MAMGDSDPAIERQTSSERSAVDSKAAQGGEGKDCRREIPLCRYLVSS